MDKNCPFCGVENSVSMVAHNGETALYHCHCCKRDFTDDDYDHEIMRQKVSAFCSGVMATEDNPIDCTADNLMECHISGIDEEAQGLCEREKPLVTKIYHDFDAVVWIEVEHYGEMELDSLITASIRDILYWLESEYDSIKKNMKNGETEH